MEIDLKGPSVEEIDVEFFRFILTRKDKLTAWEVSFFESLIKQSKGKETIKLTEKQRSKLIKIVTDILKR